MDEDRLDVALEALIGQSSFGFLRKQIPVIIAGFWHLVPIESCPLWASLLLSFRESVSKGLLNSSEGLFLTAFEKFCLQAEATEPPPIPRARTSFKWRIHDGTK